MTKFAQRGLSQAIDKELAGEGIKTCVVCPSATKTEFKIGFGRTQERVDASNWETPENVDSFCGRPVCEIGISGRISSHSLSVSS